MAECAEVTAETAESDRERFLAGRAARVGLAI